MEFFHFMQGFLSSGTLGYHCTKNSQGTDSYNRLIIRDFFITILRIYSNPQSALLIKENYIEYKANRVAPDEEFREVYVVGKV